jgi:hypothetical protein
MCLLRISFHSSMRQRTTDTRMSRTRTARAREHWNVRPFSGSIMLLTKRGWPPNFPHAGASPMIETTCDLLWPSVCWRA